MYASMQISNEWEKAHRFEDGLNDELFNAIAGMRLQTYSEVLQNAQIIADRKTRMGATSEGSNFETSLRITATKITRESLEGEGLKTRNQV